MNDYTKLRLGIIGCGAVAKQGHLPATARSDKVKVTVLVDKNIARAQNLAQQFKVPNVANDYTKIFDEVDAVIVALPHYLHAPVSIDLLTHGVHVLVEKPMALSKAECDAMIQAAERGQAVLAVGLVRRFRWSAQLAKAILDLGLLGRIESFDVQDGEVYNWPVASDFFFRRETAGGGVLIDTGAHTLDTLLWWFGDVASFEYFDDNHGGVEADSKLYLEMTNGVTGAVELSRTRNLRNTAIIQGERATLEVPCYTNKVSLHLRKAAFKIVGNVLYDSLEAKHEQSTVDLLTAQLADWVNAIGSGSPPTVSGAEGQRSIALIEACYARRKPSVFPWMVPDVTVAGPKVRETGR